MIFERITEMVEDLNSTNSNNDKAEKLSKYKDLEKFLEYTYSPLKQFYVTSKTIKSHPDIDKKWSVNEKAFIKLLDKLSKREITGHSALAAVKAFAEYNKKYEDIIYNIIDKNLKIRMSASTINKVFPNLVPEFKVQLAEKFEEERAPDFKRDTWYYSRKMDGIRCLSIVKDKDVKFFSRAGKELLVLDKVREAIEKELIKTKVIKGDFVLDGEICLVDEKGNENFTDVMKEIRRKDHTIENPRFKIFDILTLDDFVNKESKSLFNERYKIYFNINSPSGILDPVEQIKIEDFDHLMKQLEYANNHGWEGLIIRKNVHYAGKRSRDMLKVKTFSDAEFKVLEVETGPFRIIDKNTGLEKEEEMLSNVIIEFKKNKVSVGSGFSLEERRKFFKNPKDIIGKTITVKYFEESVDQNGNPSLRFPTLKAIHGVEREV